MFVRVVCLAKGVPRFPARAQTGLHLCRDARASKSLCMQRASPLTPSLFSLPSSAGLSKGDDGKMYTCETCPYPDDLTNGNADFSEATYKGTAQFIKKGTAYMNGSCTSSASTRPRRTTAMRRQTRSWRSLEKGVPVTPYPSACHPPPRNPLMPEAVAPKQGDVGSLCHPVRCCAIFLWC